MAFFKKVYAKLLGEEEEVESEEELRETPPVPVTPVKEKETREITEEKVSKPMTAPSRSIELKIAKLTSFNEQVMEVADHLIAGRPVVLNLEGATKDATKRIIDFFSGVAYTLQGQLKTIAGSIYIVTPSSVDVSHETLLAASAAKASEPSAPVTPSNPPPKPADTPSVPTTSLYDGF